MEKYINSKGKKIIGWDEILEGDINPSATIMSWTGVTPGVKAAKAGHDVISHQVSMLISTIIKPKKFIKSLKQLAVTCQLKRFTASTHYPIHYQ